MRIVDIRETAIPLKSQLANSSFDFSEMTTSVVAVITDVVRDGAPVVGFAFNSTGRYACGAQMRARFIPRILAAKPDSLLDDAGDNFDPAKILACMMQREKAGGHSERSIAIGTIEVAVWDAVAKIADKPLHRLLAERFNGGRVADKVFCYVGGGWYSPGQTIADLQDEMRRHLDAGYTMVKMKVGGLPLAEDLRRARGGAGGRRRAGRLAVDANCKFGRDEALAYARALAPPQAALVRGAVRSARLRAARRDRERLRAAARDRRESLLDAGRGEPGALRRLARRRATSSRSTRRRPTASCNMRAPSRCSSATAGSARRCSRTAATRCRSPSPAASASAARNPIPACSALSAASPTMPGSTTGRSRSPDRPGIGFEAQAALYRIMRELAA